MVFLAWLLSFFSALQPSETIVRLKNDVPPATWLCTLPRGGQIRDAFRTGTLSWPCALTGTLQCDAEGYEPFDLTRNDCVASVTVNPQRARFVRILSQPSRTEVTVEWRAMHTDRTELIASRRVVLNGDVRLPFSSRTRILRFFREHAAPASFVLERGAEVLTAKLPPVEAGGEILFLGAKSDIGPTELTGLGMRPFNTNVQRASYARAAVYPGDYSLKLMFSSGITSGEVKARVHSGATTEVWSSQFGAFGAVQLSPDAALTEQEGNARLFRIIDEAGTMTQTEVWSSASTGQRGWLVDGLSEGVYEAHLDLVDGTSSRGSVVVEENAVSQLRLTGAKVRVFGQVKIGGAPAPGGTRIQFVARTGAASTPKSLKPFETQVDNNGNFNVSLGDPGRYTARLASTKYLTTWTDVIEVGPGLNRFDWNVPGGSLEILLRREDGRPLDEIVQLQIDGGRFHAAAPILQEETTAAFIAVGLPLSTPLTIKADTSSSLVAEPAKIELTAARPNAKLTLVLRNMTSTIEVRNSVGDLVRTATAVAGNLILQQEPPDSGYLKLRRTSPGTALLIEAANHVPVCHVFKATDVPITRVQLINQNLIPTEIRLSVKATRPVGYFLGLPGSDCPVPLLNFKPAMRYDGTTVVFSLMLPAGTYQYTPYGRYPLQTFTVPGKGLNLEIPPQ